MGACSGGSEEWGGGIAQRYGERIPGKYSSEDNSSSRHVKSGSSYPGGLRGPDSLTVC